MVIVKGYPVGMSLPSSSSSRDATRHVLVYLKSPGSSKAGVWFQKRPGMRFFIFFRGFPNSHLRKIPWVVYFYISLSCKLPWRKFTFTFILTFREVVLFPGLDIIHFTSYISRALCGISRLDWKSGLFLLIA